MSLSLTGYVTVDVSAPLVNTASDGTGVTDPFRRTGKKVIANGTGSGKAQIAFHTQRTLLTGADETLDLRALDAGDGSVFGTYTFSKIKAIIVDLETATAGYRLEIGAAASNEFIGPLKAAGDIAVVAAGSRWLQESWVDGWTVDVTHKDLKIANPAGGSAVYRLIIIGEGTIA